MITHSGITIELPLPSEEQIIEEGYLRMIANGNPDKEMGKLHGFIDGSEYILSLIKTKHDKRRTD